MRHEALIRDQEKQRRRDADKQRSRQADVQSSMSMCLCAYVSMCLCVYVSMSMCLCVYVTQGNVYILNCVNVKSDIVYSVWCMVYWCIVIDSVYEKCRPVYGSCSQGTILVLFLGNYFWSHRHIDT
jgi:hypothetical protein